MPIQFVFWLLMALWLIFGIARPNWAPTKAALTGAAGDLVPFLAVCCLGWVLFGPAVT